MFCPKCGKENDNENRFCFNCGAPLPVTGEGSSSQNEQGTAPREDKAKEEKAPSPNPTMSVTIDGNALKLLLTGSGIVIAVLYALFAIRSIPTLFLGIRLIFRGLVLYGLDSVASTALTILSRVVMAAGLLLFALSRDDERDNTENLLLVVASCGILRIVIQLVAQIILALAVFARYGHFAFSGVTFGKALLYAILAVAIEVALTFLAGYRPFIGKSADDLKNEILNLPNVLLEEIEILGKKFKEKTGQKQSWTDGTSGNSEVGPIPMNEKRSYLVYLLVGMITCGIYVFYVIYTFARDVNIICKEDGETTPGLLKLILLSLVTCGVYNFVWYYKLLNRIERQEKNWNIQPITVGGIELGAAWLLMKIVGLVVTICGIGVIISCYADYLVFRNLNELSKEYNKRVVGQSSETV